MNPIARWGRGLASRLLRMFKEKSGLVSGFSDLEMHLWMLSDDVRADAYERAIRKAVSPGAIVADVGAGTGLLSMMACRAGAGKVYAIEKASVIQLARELAERNGYAGKIEFIHADARRISLPRKADLVVSETIGSFAFSEEIVSILGDARARLLAPGGTLIPSRLIVSMAPIETFTEGIGFWERPIRGLDYTPVIPKLPAGKVLPARDIGPENHLAGSRVLYDVDFTRDNSGMSFSRELEFTASRDGRLHGFVGSWATQLLEGITLRCEPGAPKVHWTPALFRLPSALPVSRGSRIKLTFGRQDRPGWHWSWSARVGD